MNADIQQRHVQIMLMPSDMQLVAVYVLQTQQSFVLVPQPKDLFQACIALHDMMAGLYQSYLIKEPAFSQFLQNGW